MHGPAIVAKWSPPILRPPMSITVRLPCVTWLEASLNGRLMGMVWSTPGATSSASSRTSSTSPTTPITCCASPSITWARAPVASTRVTTSDTSSGVASCLITIIISSCNLSNRRVLRAWDGVRVGRVLPRRRTPS